MEKRVNYYLLENGKVIAPYENLDYRDLYDPNSSLSYWYITKKGTLAQAFDVPDHYEEGYPVYVKEHIYYGKVKKTFNTITELLEFLKHE